MSVLPDIYKSECSFHILDLILLWRISFEPFYILSLESGQTRIPHWNWQLHFLFKPFQSSSLLSQGRVWVVGVGINKYKAKERIQKKAMKFWKYFQIGCTIPSSLVWIKIGLDKYSYCLPYLPTQKGWTFSNWSVFLNIHFLTFERILLVNIQVKYYL